MLNRAGYIFLLSTAIILVVAADGTAAQFARPDGTEPSSSGWTATGAPTLHEATDETAVDDADYMTTGGSATGELSLSDIADPGVDTGHIIRFRMISTGSKGGERLDFRLLQGSTEIVAYGNLQSRGSYTTFVYALDAATVANISNYSDLRYEASTTSVDSGEEMRISWMELEVPDASGATAPTLSSSTVTGVDTTSATLGATITDNGGDSSLTWGTVWKVSSPVLVTDNPSNNSGTVSAPPNYPFSELRNSPAMPAGTQIYYRGYATNSEGTGYSSEESFYTEPTQAADANFANVTETGMRITWTAGGGDGSIVVVKQGSAVDAVPVDGTAHNGSTVFESGDNLGGNNYVVYRDTGTQVDITGLTPGATYHVAVYEYAGSGSLINYQQDNAPIGNDTTTGGGPVAPTLSSSTVSGVDTTSATLGATITDNGGNSSLTWGTVWKTSPGVLVTDNNSINSGTVNAPPNYPFSELRNSPAMPAGTEIFYRGYATNSEGTGYSSEESFYTEPTQAADANFANVTETGMRITWTAGGGDGSIVVVKQGSAVDAAPVDGTAHNGSTVFESGDNLGSDNYVVYRDTTTQVDITGLDPNTTYYVAIYEYAGSGSQINYQQDSATTGSQNTAEAVVSEGHNNSQSIECLYCHNMHDALVPEGTGQEIVCKSCHNIPSMGAGPMADVNNHVVDGGATIVDCGSCHEVHNGYDFTTTDTHPDGITTQNLKRIRWDIAKYEPNAVEPAVLHDPNVLAFDQSPWNGVCQACHTTTSKHRNDGTGDQTHEITNPDGCALCHTHDTGFSASGGGCTACHDKVQDDDTGDGVPARRAIVGGSGDFSLASHHVAGGSATDADCAVCHMESETGHKNGLIDLRNPDTGGAITGFLQFTRNTSSNNLESWVTDVQNDLCMKCHDADGATVSAIDPNFPLQPFSSNTRNAPNIFAALDTGNTFFHPVRGAANNPFCTGVGAASTMESPWNQNDDHNVISCFDCHGVNGHGGANNYNLKTQITGTSDAAGIRTFCTSCHKDGSYFSGNTGSDFSDHSRGQHRDNPYACRGCHAGQVDDDADALSDNGGRNPQIMIHGGSFTWDSESETPGVATDTFMFGGWLGGLDPVTRNCFGGGCSHTTGSKNW